MSGLVEVTPVLLRSMPLPALDSGDKDMRGRVMIVGGSVEVPGAALLAGISALRAGAGKLQIATCASVAPHMALAVPEALVIALGENDSGAISPDAGSYLAGRMKRCDGVVIGPGMMDEDATAALTAQLLIELDRPGIVLDAGAMAQLTKQAGALRNQDGRVVITPHPGEMATLLDTEKQEVERDPLRAARRAADTLGVFVVLKSSETHIVSPTGEAWVFRHGCVGLATCGSGDVLAGVIGGLLARGAAPAVAAMWGVHLHAAAGHRLEETQGPLGFLARELPAEIPRIMAELGRPN